MSYKRLANEKNEKGKIIEYLQFELDKKDREMMSKKVETKLQNSEELKSEQKNLVEENNYLRNLLEDNEQLELDDYLENRYTTHAVGCVMNLLTFNIAAKIGCVIETICSLCKLNEYQIKYHFVQQ